MSTVPSSIAERLRADPSDPLTLAVFTDWLEENGFDHERIWMLDQRADMAALFRPQSQVPDPLPGIPSSWLRTVGGLVVGLRVPERQASRAVPTVKRLLGSPLAVTLVSVVAHSGPAAAAWLPALRRLPHLRSLHLGADVDPRLAEGFSALRHLSLSTVVRPAPGRVALPTLERLEVEVRGQRLDVLDALAPAGVDELVLQAPDWEQVPTAPLERFYERVPVGHLSSEGRARAVLPRPEVQARDSAPT